MIDPIRASNMPSGIMQFAVRGTLQLPSAENVEILARLTLAVLRPTPLKRRFMKNYIVVRNLVRNPPTPLDLSLGLMKNLLTQELKNLSNNKQVSDTIRKLALKMYKQTMEETN